MHRLQLRQLSHLFLFDLRVPGLRLSHLQPPDLRVRFVCGLVRQLHVRTVHVPHL